MLLLVFILYGTSETFLLGSFANLEERMILQNVDRAQLALSSDIDQLNSTLGDWAPWNDTYAFMMDRNQRYIDANLNVATLANLRLNLILFIDTNGQLVFAKAVNLQTIVRNLTFYTKHLPQENVQSSTLQSLVLMRFPERNLELVSAYDKYHG